MVSKLEWRIFFALLLCMALNVDLVVSSKEVMKSLTAGFAKAFTECNKELNLPDRITKDLYFFWGEEYELVNKELGCAIRCMAGKFDMITEDAQLHHENTHEFAKKHGADDDMAKQLVTILHDCEKNSSSVSDECERVLEIAKCFRTKIHSLKWAPTMEIVLEEVMTEV